MLYSPVQSYTMFHIFQKYNMIQIELYIIQDCVRATSYIEMSAIQSLYMLYSIGGKYHGKAYNCDKNITWSNASQLT